MRVFGRAGQSVLHEGRREEPSRDEFRETGRALEELDVPSGLPLAAALCLSDEGYLLGESRLSVLTLSYWFPVTRLPWAGIERGCHRERSRTTFRGVSVGGAICSSVGSGSRSGPV